MYVAILEDDADQAGLLQAVLEAAGHRCQLFGLGERLLSGLGRETFDLLIIDWLLPDIPGDEVLRRVRARQDWHVPVLFVTQRDSEQDVVQALSAGADDYMAKPVKTRELIARVEALGRRLGGQQERAQVLELGPLRFDLTTRTAFLDDAPVTLTDTEFRLAVMLCQNPGRMYSRSHILEVVWGRNPDMETRTVDVHVSRLRRKLKLNADTGWVLKSVYQQGYRLEPVAENG